MLKSPSPFSMFQVIEAQTADALWQKAADWFRPGGIARSCDSRAGEISEVLHAALTLRDPMQRWIASRSPAMNPAFAIAEVLWIMNGRKDAAFLNFFNPQLPKFQGNGTEYYGAYGFRLRRHFQIDQLSRAYQALLHKPNSRQVVLQIWDPESDMPNEDGTPRDPDVPCNVAAFIKVRDGKVEWTQAMRSNDVFLGLPHNIVQFTCLQEIFAGWLGLELGSYNHFTDSLHLYARDGQITSHIDAVEVPRNEDSLRLPKGESEQAIEALSAFTDILVADTSNVPFIIAAFEELTLPPAYTNFAAILAAEALRRKRAISEAIAMVNHCSNHCLRFVFARWNQRNNSSSKNYQSLLPSSRQTSIARHKAS